MVTRLRMEEGILTEVRISARGALLVLGAIVGVGTIAWIYFGPKPSDAAVANANIAGGIGAILAIWISLWGVQASPPSGDRGGQLGSRDEPRPPERTERSDFPRRTPTNERPHEPHTDLTQDDSVTGHQAGGLDFSPPAQQVRSSWLAAGAIADLGGDPSDSVVVDRMIDRAVDRHLYDRTWVLILAVIFSASSGLMLGLGSGFLWPDAPLLVISIWPFLAALTSMAPVILWWRRASTEVPGLSRPRTLLSLLVFFFSSVGGGVLSQSGVSPEMTRNSLTWHYWVGWTLLMAGLLGLILLGGRLSLSAASGLVSHFRRRGDLVLFGAAEPIVEILNLLADPFVLATTQGKIDIVIRLRRAAASLEEVFAHRLSDASMRIAKVHLRQSADWLRSFEAWVALPIDDTAANLRRELGPFLRHLIRGQLGQLPRCELYAHDVRIGSYVRSARAVTVAVLPLAVAYSLAFIDLIPRGFLSTFVVFGVLWLVFSLILLLDVGVGRRLTVWHDILQMLPDTSGTIEPK